MIVNIIPGFILLSIGYIIDYSYLKKKSKKIPYEKSKFIFKESFFEFSDSNIFQGMGFLYIILTIINSIIIKNNNISTICFILLIILSLIIDLAYYWLLHKIRIRLLKYFYKNKQ